MLNKLKKTISIAKFNRAQDKRFASVLDQNFDLKNNSAILKTSILAGLIAAGCFWLVAISLEAQASKLDSRLEQQEFYNIIRTTHQIKF